VYCLLSRAVVADFLFTFFLTRFFLSPNSREGSKVHSHSIMQRALCQRASQDIEMAVEPEGGKLAHGRLQTSLPVRA
jgi:hypothetical protein